jgi:hypothetical protein
MQQPTLGCLSVELGGRLLLLKIRERILAYLKSLSSSSSRTRKLPKTATIPATTKFAIRSARAISFILNIKERHNDKMIIIANNNRKIFSKVANLDMFNTFMLVYN